MRKILYILILMLVTVPSVAQIQLTIEGKDTIIDTPAYNIPRDYPTDLIFRNNRLRKTYSSNYVLLCGDDSPQGRNNNLDSAVITGNWLNSVEGGQIHGMMVGFSVDYVLKWNRIANSSYGMVIEGDTGQYYSAPGSGPSYNIYHSNSLYPIILFGPDSVRIYNNTLYTDRDQGGQPKYEYGIIRILTNPQHGYDITTKGTKIYNNIFYGVNDQTMITVDSMSMANLECDYNAYYSEGGDVYFRNSTYDSAYSFTEWQAKGFDAHSQVINPGFIDTVNFEPAVDLSFGLDLGSDYEYGLSGDSEWVPSYAPDTVQQNNGVWQVGAVVRSLGNNKPMSSSGGKFMINKDGNLLIRE